MYDIWYDIYDLIFLEVLSWPKINRSHKGKTQKTKYKCRSYLNNLKQGQPETIPAPGELRKEIIQSGIWYILSKNWK